MSEISKDCLTEIHRLIERLTSAGAKSESRDELVRIIQRLDEIAAKQTDELPKDLLHYLQRRSYEKALNFLHPSRSD